MKMPRSNNSASKVLDILKVLIAYIYVNVCMCMYKRS